MISYIINAVAQIVITVIATVIAGIMSNYIYKYLDRNSKRTNDVKSASVNEVTSNKVKSECEKSRDTKVGNQLNMRCLNNTNAENGESLVGFGVVGIFLYISFILYRSSKFDFEKMYIISNLIIVPLVISMAYIFYKYKGGIKRTLITFVTIALTIFIWFYNPLRFETFEELNFVGFYGYTAQLLVMIIKVIIVFSYVVLAIKIYINEKNVKYVEMFILPMISILSFAIVTLPIAYFNL